MWNNHNYNKGEKEENSGVKSGFFGLLKLDSLKTANLPSLYY